MSGMFVAVARLTLLPPCIEPSIEPSIEHSIERSIDHSIDPSLYTPCTSARPGSSPGPMRTTPEAGRTWLRFRCFFGFALQSDSTDMGAVLRLRQCALRFIACDLQVRPRARTHVCTHAGACARTHACTQNEHDVDNPHEPITDFSHVRDAALGKLLWL